MRRRDFLALLGGALALSPMALRAQKAIPVIGFLRSTTASPFTHLVKAFHDGRRRVSPKARTLRSNIDMPTTNWIACPRWPRSWCNAR